MRIWAGLLVLAALLQAGYGQVQKREIPLAGAPGLKLYLESGGEGGSEDETARLERLVSQYEAQLGKASGDAGPKRQVNAAGTFLSETKHFAQDRLHNHFFVTMAGSSAVCHMVANRWAALPQHLSAP